MKKVRVLLLISLGAAMLMAQTATEKVLIRTSKPYTRLVNAVEAAGGRVTYQFRYVNGIAAEIPRSALAAIGSLVTPGAISRDLTVPAPKNIDTAALRPRLARTGDEQLITAESVQALPAAEIAALARVSPNAYLLNNSVNNTTPLHGLGIAGAGVIVAVIDSGIRPGFPHLSLDGSVIACEDFVEDALGCSNWGNDGHGTFVAGMISANVVFGFPASSTFRNAVLAECPACFSNPPTNTRIPMIGTAPLSSIYALRVFGPQGGAPTSRILAAVERVIELREKHDAGDASGSNIQVCNLSLGGPTVYAGRDLFDTAIDVMLTKGIVPVISAGNTGPSSLTVGSPGSSISALTVGAASLAHNERILRRLQAGSVNGALYRPFLGMQTAYFSSRGPDADGRNDPDVTANGFASYGQGFGATTSDITLGSGTSFSTPSVAGVAALLRQSFPTATARQIRNAIIASANPELLADGSTELDRGAGYVDALAARNLLATGAVPDTLPPPGVLVKNVEVNVEAGSFLKVYDGLVRRSFTGLKPGERAETLYRVHPGVKQVIVSLTNVTPALPPAQQNQLFGDDILLAIHTAKTSAIGDDGDYKVFTYTVGGAYMLDNPETGLVRVTVSGDWTNAGTISANLTIFSITDPVPQITAQGKIEHAQMVVKQVTVPLGTAKAEFMLGWREDWASYPTNDVDLILVSPDGGIIYTGATLNNPERVTINNPMAGRWLSLIQGFEVWSGEDKYELRVTLDGKVVK